MVHEKLEFHTQVSHGKIPREISEEIRDVIRRMEGKKITITVSKYRRKRSIWQNRYYWGVVIQYVTKMFEDEGNVITEEEVHDFLKSTVGKLYRTVVDPAGEVHQTLKSSTELDTREWEDYMEQVRAWAAAMGTVIPLPNEL